jgi:hypothetical protein
LARNAGLPWVTQPQHFPTPNGVESIPHISFVKFDLVTAQQLPEFVLKRHFAMMFFLPGGGVIQPFQVCWIFRFANPG